TSRGTCPHGGSPQDSAHKAAGGSAHKAAGVRCNGVPCNHTLYHVATTCMKGNLRSLYMPSGAHTCMQGNCCVKAHCAVFTMNEIVTNRQPRASGTQVRRYTS
ncbi:unnamed protein product, partial [Ectocarpus fasciculatus]